MYFSNEFLYDFTPVYEGILAAKSVKPECAIVEVIDEEPDGAGMFETGGEGGVKGERKRDARCAGADRG